MKHLLPLLLALPLAAQEYATVTVLPPTVQLDSGRDEQRVVAIGVRPTGVVVELTDVVAWELADDAPAAGTPAAGTPAELRRDGTVRLVARADGDATLIARLGQHEVRVPVRVHGAALRPPISFTNEILPILTRSGCNAGSCHGAAAGKNGFGLSLFAYDPGRDHFVLTRQLRGRRIDPAEPEQSLMLQKSGGLVPHQGGRKLPPDGPLHREVSEWIAAGAPDDRKTAPALQGIEVLPKDAVLVAGSGLHLQVLARYADGSDRDVTALTLWSSNNDGAAAVAGDGAVRAAGAGEAAVLARFSGCAATAQLLVLADDAPFTWPSIDAVNFVDAAIHKKLQRARVVPADVAGDAVFVRRLYLDLLDILPTPEQATAFVADAAADKRARLVDALLERPEFAAVQAMAWAEVLRIDNDRMEPKGATLLVRWLREQFAAHRPLDAMVKDLLVAEGPTFRNPPANFWLAADQPNLLAEHVAQDFLGIRVQCAQCHNHPFENWTMDDYYGFAAFFGQLARKRGEDGAEWIVWNRGGGEVRHKRDNAVAAPRFLGGGPATVPSGADRRTVLADWLVQSPAFARNISNRLWARLLGRGIVEPPDDVRISNPPSHGELLQQLADLLVQSHFDVRPVVAAICKSRTYQLAARPTPAPPSLFAGNQVRRLAAEPLLDAIAAVTGVPTKYPGVPLGGNATAIASGRTGLRFLDIFGRPARDSSCTCDRREEPTLGQALHLIQGDTIAQKIADGKGRLRTALANKQAPEAMLDELCLAAYARPATAAEKDRLLADVRQAKDDAGALAAFQDVYWAVLNSKEFLFNH